MPSTIALIAHDTRKDDIISFAFDASAYCQARSRLPETLLENLFVKAAQSLEEKVTLGGRA